MVASIGMNDGGINWNEYWWHQSERRLAANDKMGEPGKTTTCTSSIPFVVNCNIICAVVVVLVCLLT